MQPTMAAESFSTLRNTHGSAIFTGKLGKPEHKTNYAARFAFRSATIGSDLLQWMQSDPTLPRSAQQMKQAVNFARAFNKAKQLSDGNKVQIMASVVSVVPLVSLVSVVSVVHTVDTMTD